MDSGKIKLLMQADQDKAYDEMMERLNQTSIAFGPIRSTIEPVEEYRKRYEAFVNDPVIAEFNKAAFYIIERSIPSYVCVVGGEMQAQYDQETQSKLDELRSKLNEYIKTNYS